MKTRPIDKQKGKIAEDIVEIVFSARGYDVIRNGIEFTHPALVMMRNKKHLRQPDATPYRQDPDFFINHRNVHDNRPSCLVEVKFRMSSFLYYEDVEHIHNDVHLILVGPRQIWSVPMSDIRESGAKGLVRFDRFRKLEADRWFGFSPEDKKFMRDELPKLLAAFRGYQPSASLSVEYPSDHPGAF